MDWINVKDKLPEQGQRVIYYFSITGIEIGKYEKTFCEDLGYSFDCFHGLGGWLCDDVTHWIPLPNPPTTDKI